MVHLSPGKDIESGFSFIDGYLISSEGIKIQLFMKVKVNVQVEEAGAQAQRSKLFVRLIEPYIEGVSIESSNKKQKL